MTSQQQYEHGRHYWATVRGQKDVVVAYDEHDKATPWLGPVSTLRTSSGLPTADGWWHADSSVSDVRPAIILDLDPTVVTEDLGAERNEAQRLIDMLRESADAFFTRDAAALARRVASQIEAQTKPARMDEPTEPLAEVVASTPGAIGGTRRFVRGFDTATGHRWVDGVSGWDWAELIDPRPVKNEDES